MANKRRFKQSVSVLALSALVWSGTAFPAPQASAAARPFGDVPSGYWAEKHIVKLALQGIISGKGEGKFAPNESIRREDAVLLALQFLGAADDIDSSGSIVFPGSFKVDNYAIAYINEAFKRKLLLAEEEYALANQEPGKSWGQSPATREWVARLLVRAIGKDAAAAANAGKMTAFADDAKIDAKLRPYVLTAVENGLVAGIETTVGGVKKTIFEPKASINRASIARLFSLAESQVSVAHSGQVSGVLLSVGPDKLAMLFDNGTINDYTLTSSTFITRLDSEKSVPLASLKLYGKASLILDADGAVGYVEQTDDKAYVNVIDGKFSKLNSASSTIWLSVGDDFKGYSFDSAHMPLVTDSLGNTIALADIPEGASVTLKVDTIRTDGKVVAASVKQSLINKKASGTVVSWDSAAGMLQVADPSTGTAEALSVSAQTAFTLDGVPVKSDQLKAGDSITYEIKGGFVIGVEIAKPVVTAVSGKFLSADKTEKTITYTENSELRVKRLTSSATVKIEGMQNAGMEDLQKDDAITMTLDAKGDVTQVAVTNRSVETLVGLTVEAYVAKTRNLSLSDSANKAHNVELGSNVRYDLNGTKLETAAALSLLTPGKRVNISYSGGTAISVSLVSKFSGQVVENNTTTKMLKIRTDPVNVLVVPYTTPSVEIYGQTTASFTDVKTGDQVTVLLNGSQDQAATIQVQKTAQFEVVSTDVSGSKIRVKKAGGTPFEEFPLASTVPLQDENGVAVTLGQFAAGSTVNITFVGKTTPAKVKTVTFTYGKILSVNAGASTVSVALPNGTTVTKDVGASPLIVRGGVSSDSLSSVQANERVEIHKDENDRTVIEIIPALAKVFWRYDSAGKSILVKHSNFTETYSFLLDSQVYIHQDNAVLTAVDLKDGDKVSLYILRGKLIEVSKN